MQKVHHKNFLAEPKSEQARRQVAAPAFVLRPLQERRGTGLMFATRNGTPFLHRNIERYFKKTLVKSGLPCIRFHHLRHTFASIMLAQNVHLKAVQEALGHSSITLTLHTYSHFMPRMQRETAGKLNQALGVA
jgi:integrase